MDNHRAAASIKATRAHGSAAASSEPSARDRNRVHAAQWHLLVDASTRWAVAVVHSPAGPSSSKGSVSRFRHDVEGTPIGDDRMYRTIPEPPHGSKWSQVILSSVGRPAECCSSSADLQVIDGPRVTAMLRSLLPPWIRDLTSHAYDSLRVQDTAAYPAWLKKMTHYLLGACFVLVLAACTSSSTHTFEPTVASAPASLPSPGDGRIGFVSRRDGNDKIYVMNADGSDAVRLTNHAASDSWLAWSPDGKRIAFVSNRDGNDNVHVMNADGSGVVRLTNSPADDRRPRWSPDGRRIAFQSTRDGRWQIYVLNADGSEQTDLTDNPAWDASPAWSPDGKRIAFTSNRAGYGDIYLMVTDGSEVTRLTMDAVGDAGQDWSPDGLRIAFTPLWHRQLAGLRGQRGRKRAEESDEQPRIGR